LIVRVTAATVACVRRPCTSSRETTTTGRRLSSAASQSSPCSVGPATWLPCNFVDDSPELARTMVDEGLLVLAQRCAFLRGKPRLDLFGPRASLEVVLGRFLDPRTAVLTWRGVLRVRSMLAPQVVDDLGHHAAI